MWGVTLALIPSYLCKNINLSSWTFQEKKSSPLLETWVIILESILHHTIRQGGKNNLAFCEEKKFMLI
jgi:hypothetical protein